MQTDVQQQIDTLLKNLSHEELLSLIERIARQLRNTEHPPQPLYGVWKGKFPEDADINETLREIRSQWREDVGE